MNFQKPEVLILDLDRTPCSAGTCEGLPVLVRANFLTVEIHEHNRLSPSSLKDLDQPELIFLRTSSLSSLPAVIERLRAQQWCAPVIGVICVDPKTDCKQDALWLNCLDDLLCCPFDQLDLAFRIRKVLRVQSKVGGALRSAPLSTAFRAEGLVGESACFLAAVEKIPHIANSEATVLIEGETGTGKELFARAIHYHGPRKGKPFEPVNCGALPDHLFENELFGHAKGAFTDAGAEQKGLIQEAEGGTLFLDEVDALTPSTQIKLLRFLQDKAYRPLGSSRTLTSNVRILAATNRDLKQLVQEGRLRDDLYYRLNVLIISIPPMRDRLDDIQGLANFFLSRMTKRSEGQSVQLTQGAMFKLQGYHWPGNVRELESVMQRVCTFTTSHFVGPQHIDLPSMDQSGAESEGLFQQAKDQVVMNFERDYLTHLLTTHLGNISQAAKAAGKERRAFKRLLIKHQLDRKAFLVQT